MKKSLVAVLVLGLASGAGAALKLVDKPADPIAVGEIAALKVESTSSGVYTGWLSIADPTIADFENVTFTAAGNPSGASTATAHPEFGAWIEFTVASFPPAPQIAPGEHIVVEVKGKSQGTTKLTLYGSDGELIWDSADINVIPEPMTIALLGLGSLFLRRRA